MEKVRVINSPLFKDKVDGYDEDSLPPLGLGYIATDLAQKGHETELHDAVALNTPLKDLIADIEESTARVIALNVFTTNLHLVRDIVESVTREVHFVIGGLSTRQVHQEIFDWKTSNDITVVMGDGERIMADIVDDNVQVSPQLEDIRAGGRRRYFAVTQGSPYYVSDISDLPLDRDFFTNEPVFHLTHDFHEANIVTSRGCIYNCAFCSAARSLNRPMGIRIRKPDSVRKEVQHLKAIYPGLDSVRALDDLFLRDRQSIADAIGIFQGTNLKWRAMAHVMSFKRATDSDLTGLKRSGCHELFIGIESGSPSVLKRIHKTAKPDVIKNTVARVLDAGISVKGYFIYGFPDETEDDCQQTFDLAQSLKDSEGAHGSRFRTSTFRFRPYHGTELFHDLEMAGRSFTVDRDRRLTDVQDRQQFNFYVENFANCDEALIDDFIRRTNALNHE